MDLIEWVNTYSKEAGIINRLHGHKIVDGTHLFLIAPEDREIYWFSKEQLSTTHEEAINKYLELYKIKEYK